LGAFKKVDANAVIAFASNNQVKYGTGTTFSTIPRTFTNIQDVKVTIIRSSYPMNHRFMFMVQMEFSRRILMREN
jgi:hypothetical protein